MGCDECEPGVKSMVSSAIRKDVKMNVANVTGDPKVLKSVSEVLGKLLDSRTSYIASVTVLQRAG